ncbi:azurin [Pseudomonas sp. KNUC1026]|uniref:azurin n=1 Tax=Pseudomonas sp. KNUC1026 TaxID=2893890 RepID=UPI001F18F4D3|nr:azurin [Pseudomonas sp. KNUC1026]UFH49851.1 azurin [Pseudomonas sp. KNUC1026]
MNARTLIAALFALATAPVWANDACSTDIAGTDQMTYDKSEIVIPKSCKTFTVTLKHPGEMPVSVMGHNWVLAKTDDLEGIDADGQDAGESNNYLKPGDSRVLAHTRLIGAGEQDSVTFDTALLKAGTAYSFFCSYPVHANVMKGEVKLGG